MHFPVVFFRVLSGVFSKTFFRPQVSNWAWIAIICQSSKAKPTSSHSRSLWKLTRFVFAFSPLPNTRFENWLFSFFPDVYTRNSLGVCRADNCYGRFASRYWRERSQAVEIERKTLREPFHLNFWNASRVISCRFGKQTPSFMISELICAHDLFFYDAEQEMPF